MTEVLTMICSICKRDAECRMHTTNGAYGPVDVQTCRACHEKEIASVRAEAKRFGFKLTLPKKWDKLTTQGCYSICT